MNMEVKPSKKEDRTAADDSEVNGRASDSACTFMSTHTAGDTSDEESVISSSIPDFGKVTDSVSSCRDEVIEVGVAIEVTLPIKLARYSTILFGTNI